MGGFCLLDSRRLDLDRHRIISDWREHCVVYRHDAGSTEEVLVGDFWGRIANIGRQTTGLEQTLVSGNVTGDLWVLHAPPEAVIILHDDEIRTDRPRRRWRVVHTRQVPNGQISILSNIQ